LGNTSARQKFLTERPARDAGGSNVRKQSRGIFLGACASAASGHAAAPPSSVMNCGASFDYLVGAREHRGRQVEAERLRGFEIDDQLVL